MASNPLAKEEELAAQSPHSIPDVLEQQDKANAGQQDTQKYTKDEVNYRSAGKSPTRCVFCAHYQPGYGTNTCAIVEGPIKPGDVCDMFKPAGKEAKPGFAPPAQAGLGAMVPGAGGSQQGQQPPTR